MEAEDDVIPISSTTISAYHMTETEPGEGRTRVLYAQGVRANIGGLGGGESNRPGGGEMLISGRFQCDTIAMTHTDIIVDETTGYTFEVQWVARKSGMGMDHLEGNCALKQGAVA